MASEIQVDGHCYCGEVRFTVTVPADERPIFAAYCHCDSCRRAHAAPLYQVVCIDETWFQITAGAERVQEFTRPGARICRAFCSTCGTRVLNRFPGWRPGGKVPLVFFPDLLEESTRRDLPAVFRARKNNAADECVLEAEMLRQVLPPA